MQDRRGEHQSTESCVKLKNSNTKNAVRTDTGPDGVERSHAFNQVIDAS